MLYRRSKYVLHVKPKSQKIERSFIPKETGSFFLRALFITHILFLKMSTRSGAIYNNSDNVSVSVVERRQNKRRQFFKPIPDNIINNMNTIEYPKRSNRTSFPVELIRDYCNDSDNDSSSDYSSEDEEVQQYNCNLPKYEVDLNLDEASTAWRANKRRVGESWVYKLNPEHPENIGFDIIDDANTSSVASRVKNNRRNTKM